MKLAIVAGRKQWDGVQTLLRRTHHQYDWFDRHSLVTQTPSETEHDLALVLKDFRETQAACLVEISRHLPQDLPMIVTEPRHLSNLLATLTPEALRAGLTTAADCSVLNALSNNHQFVRCPPYRLDLSKNRVWIAESETTLTPREFELAAYMFSRPNRMLERRRLMESIWGVNDHVLSRTLDTHISRLRNKLQLDGRHGWTLRSIYQRGYRLECPGPDGCPEQ